MAVQEEIEQKLFNIMISTTKPVSYTHLRVLTRDFEATRIVIITILDTLF